MKRNFIRSLPQHPFVIRRRGTTILVLHYYLGNGRTWMFYSVLLLSEVILHKRENVFTLTALMYAIVRGSLNDPGQAFEMVPLRYAGSLTAA